MDHTNMNGKRELGYRYKMPTPKVTYCRGKTQVTNANLIAKAIFRQPTQVNAWLKKALNTSGIVVNGVIHLAGQHQKDKILKQLLHYVQKDVLCKGCQNPESDLLNGRRKCRACGLVDRTS